MENEQTPIVSEVKLVPMLPGALDTLKQAWSIYKQRIETFLKIMIAPILMLVVGSALVALVKIGSFGVDFESLKSKGLSIGAIIILAIILFIIIIITQSLVNIALLYAVKDREGSVGVMEYYRRAWHKLGSYWWIIILTAYITMGALFLFIVPAIMLAVSFGLATYILVAEDIKGMDALFKSKEYVKGKWGAIFWRFLFIGIISFLFSMALGIILVITKIPYGNQISQLITGLFLTPLTAIYSFLVYSNLKDIKGDVAFVSTKGRKAKYILLGTFGVIILPILVSALLLGLNSSRSLSRDFARRANIATLQPSLELYYLDHSAYPKTLDDLTKPYKGKVYLSRIPIAPTPADGACTLEQNNFNYKLIDFKHYELTYCLGKDFQSKDSTGQMVTTSGGVQTVKGGY